MTDRKSFFAVLCVFFAFVYCSETEKYTISSIPWLSQDSGTNASFRGVSAVDDNTAWVSGNGGTVLRTTNAGATWERRNVTGAETLDFRDIQAFDERTAYIISAGTPAKIYKTEDGGENWAEQYYNEDPGVFFDSLDFWDRESGIAFSDPLDDGFFLISTSDGGETWERIPPENIPEPHPGEAGFAGSGTMLSVFGENSVFFGTGGSFSRFFRSADRGKTWSVYKTPIISGLSSTGIFSVVFKDEDSGIIVGGDYQKTEENINNSALTSDGGISWTEIKDGSQPAGFRECVAYIPNTSGDVLVTVGPSGSDISFDGGQAWTEIDTVGYHSVSFSHSSGAGWAVGANGKIARFAGLKKY